MKNKLIAVIIFVLLATAIIPNYIYATSLDNLEVNTQTFEDIHSSYDMDSFNQMKDSATADINVEAGTKTKTIRETLSLGAGVATAIGGLIMWPVSTVSIFITFITRGSENLLIKGDKVTEWNRSNVARMKVNGYSINWFTIEDTVFDKSDLTKSFFDNCNFDTKDSFWHAKDVVIRNSTIKGEYLAWYCENVTFENCTIIGTQPLCYCKNLKLINCKMIESDLAFEKSEVEATLVSEIVSIKNPKSGKIVVPKVGEIIRDDPNSQGEIEIIGS